MISLRTYALVEPLVYSNPVMELNCTYCDGGYMDWVARHHNMNLMMMMICLKAESIGT